MREVFLKEQGNIKADCVLGSEGEEKKSLYAVAKDSQAFLGTKARTVASTVELWKLQNGGGGKHQSWVQLRDKLTTEASIMVVLLL